MTNTLKFFWNGIKGTDGKLQKCNYSDGILRSYPAGTITIYAKSYTRFSAEIAAAFDIQNDSDGQTDYFENDHIRVTPSHPLYSQVREALAKRDAHFETRFAKKGF